METKVALIAYVEVLDELEGALSKAETDLAKLAEVQDNTLHKFVTGTRDRVHDVLTRGVFGIAEDRRRVQAFIDSADRPREEATEAPRKAILA